MRPTIGLIAIKSFVKNESIIHSLRKMHYIQSGINLSIPKKKNLSSTNKVCSIRQNILLIALIDSHNQQLS